MYVGKTLEVTLRLCLWFATQVTQERRHLSSSHNGAVVVGLDRSVGLTTARCVQCTAAAVVMNVAAAVAKPAESGEVDKAACSSASRAGCRWLREGACRRQFIEVFSHACSGKCMCVAQQACL